METGEEKKEINDDNDVGEKSNDNEWDEIDWSEVNSDKQEETIWNDINWNDDQTGEQEESVWNEIDWEEPESEKQTESDSKDEDGELEPEQLDPNEEAEKELDPKEIGRDDENPPDSEENLDNFYENTNSQLSNTVLLNENKEEIQEGKQEDLEDEIEKELEEGVEAINKYLEEEAEFINAYEEILGAYNAEQLYESLKEEETNKNKEISEKDEELENEKEVKQGEEVSELQLSEDISGEGSEISEQEVIEEEELEERLEEVEQHQVEPLIEEALETEPEPIVNEEEIERLQEMELKEQFENVHLNEQIQDIVEGQEEEIEQEQEEKVEVQTDKEINYDLEEELDLDLVEQHQVESFIEEAVDTEPLPDHNEEIDQLQELELEEQFETTRNNEYTEELVERLEELEEHNDESDNAVQENEEIEQTQERKELNYLQEKLDEQEWNLEFDYEEKDEVEQHQVETAIEEELETDPKPIVEEEKLEHIKNLEPEKQLEAELFYELIDELSQKQREEKEESEEKEECKELTKEEKVAQIMHDLEITQEINSTETEVETESNEVEFEQETILSDEEVGEQSEIEEPKDPQQELEEILEQNRKLEQEALVEIEQDEQKSEKTAKENYERAKKRYTQQTGKRPIYASKETKGFQEWLEQEQELEEKQKEEEKKEPKKEEAWKWTLKNWIVRATEIDKELKSKLLKLIERYKELAKLITKYSQLYNKAQREKLSQTEKMELKSLIKTLQRLDPTNIELFLGLREMKRYLDEQYYNNDFWDKPYVNRVRHHFFTRLSQRYNDLKKALKIELTGEILKKWIKQASNEEINPRMKTLLNEIVENYNELDNLSIRFMELYKKAQNKQISKNEKSQLKRLNKTLHKIDPVIIETFTKIRAFKRYLNDQNANLDKNHMYRILNRFLASSKQISPTTLSSINFAPLTSKQIANLEKKYQKMLEELCVQYALEFKNIIINEYGYKMLGLVKQLPLTTHFSFRLDGYIRKVTNAKRDRSISVGILERVKAHIEQEYKRLKKNPLKKASFNKVMAFIKAYQEFSKYVSGKSGQGNFSISNIKYEQNSEKLVPKSWLIENLRYLLPKKFSLPIQDNLLSWFIYGDTPSYGRVSKLKWTTEGKELLKRIYLSELLSLEYNISKLTENAFSDKGIEISNRDLETLKKKVSFLVYYYVFGGYHESTYVSKTTYKKLEVGRNFFTDEFEIIRAIFFAAAEVNNGEPLNFEELQKTSGVGDLKHHLFEGFGFGDDFDKLQRYLKDITKNRPPDSNSQIFRDAKELLDGYHDKYLAKYRAFQKTRKSKTKFQGIVHKEVDRVLGLPLTPETQVRAVVKEKYVDTKNLNGVKEKIHVHGAFRFDGYHDLTSALKKYLGLDDKWMGIAFEALGTYWHTLPAQKEADRKKRLICKEKNIIMIEIWEDYSSNTWGSELIDQIKQKTGVEIPRNKLGDLAKFLGI